MKITLPHPGLKRGASLVEIMVSIGVLAVVVPLALATMLQANEGGANSRAETRAPLIVENCLSELDMARKGLSQNLPVLQPGKEFGKDQVVCLAFAGDGKLLGKVEGSGYETGTDKIKGEDAVFLARLSAVEDKSRSDFPLMLTVKVSIERPAIAPAKSRRAMDFYTKLP